MAILPVVNVAIPGNADIGNQLITPTVPALSNTAKPIIHSDWLSGAIHYYQRAT